MKFFKITFFLLIFFSLQSCGGEDADYYIKIDVEKHDAGSNDNDDGGEGDDGNEGDDGGKNNSNPSTPIGIQTSSMAYLYIDRISNEGIFHQSAACYGDYVFLISARMTNVAVLNMRTNKRIFTLELKELGPNTIYHCNQACFGTLKYSEEDPFPLLYISQRQDKSKRCFITVFRVLPTYSGIDQEYTAFAFELIQTIYFPVATDDNCLNNVNAVIDTDNHFIYTYSRNNNSSAENAYQCKISKFSIPNTLETGTIYLSDSDILDSFFINTSAVNMQGGAYKDGILYIGRGYSSAGYINLYAVDIANRQLWFTVDLLNNGFRHEPEGAFIYNDELYIGASTGIFRFSFKYENSSAKAIAVPFDIHEPIY